MATLCGTFPSLKMLFVDDAYKGPKFAKAVAEVLPLLEIESTHPTSAVLSDAWYFAKHVTLSLALRSSGDAR